MERVGQHGTQKSSREGSQLSRSRTLTSSEEEQITRLKAWMAATYSNQEVTPELSKVWTADWSKIVIRYGADVLVEALRRHRDACDFLPTPHQVNLQVASIRSEKAGAEAYKNTQRILSEQEMWKRQCLEEGGEWVHPDKQIKILEMEVIGMRRTCAKVFGEEWRMRFPHEDLTKVYRQAMEAA